jgi:hypothetical protein
MNVAAFVLLPALLTQPVASQPDAHRFERDLRLEQNMLRAGRLAYLSAAAFDGVTTVFMMRAGGCERNPIARPFRKNTAAIVVAGAAFRIGADFLIRKTIAKKWTGLAGLLYFGGAANHAAFGTGNIGLLRDRSRRIGWERLELRLRSV